MCSASVCPYPLARNKDTCAHERIRKRSLQDGGRNLSAIIKIAQPIKNCKSPHVCRPGFLKTELTLLPLLFVHACTIGTLPASSSTPQGLTCIIEHRLEQVYREKHCGVPWAACRLAFG
mmetsp:Transcript_7221/g.13371  ORF Transcript_7221/g.13371 Transcript_7221/m.13371 type:complete len:119 (+) Transcript_7221:161-517(+)